MLSQASSYIAFRPPHVVIEPITADSEILTPVSHRWSIVTFSLSRTVFGVLIIMRFTARAPKIGVLPLKSP